MKEFAASTGTVDQETAAGLLTDVCANREKRKSFLFTKTCREGDPGLLDWIRDNRAEFNDTLYRHAAILFRGFKINTVAKFEEVSQLFESDTREYLFRSSPRLTVGKQVYTSTSYPKESVINLHSEASYTPYKDIQCVIFCCIDPAPVGGETPIADNRRILRHLSDKTRAKFEEKGVRYVRNLHKNAGLSWQEVFQTTDRAEVEAECRRTGMDFTWKDEDGLSLTWVKKAIWQHPVTGEPVWYNHAFFFNRVTFERDFGPFEADRLPYNSFYGDGTEISPAEMEEIRTAYEKSTLQFPWEKGDVLFLDNLMASHGRNAYDGRRKVLAAMF
jgi:alpha-ketoglutarate-dependent taurine dioxygenase